MKWIYFYSNPESHRSSSLAPPPLLSFLSPFSFPPRAWWHENMLPDTPPTPPPPLLVTDFLAALGTILLRCAAENKKVREKMKGKLVLCRVPGTHRNIFSSSSTSFPEAFCILAIPRAFPPPPPHSTSFHPSPSRLLRSLHSTLRFFCEGILARGACTGYF